MPPILRLDLPAQNGEVDVKTAYLPRFDSFAIKVSPGFFNNPTLGLPSLQWLDAGAVRENRPDRSGAAR